MFEDIKELIVSIIGIDPVLVKPTSRLRLELGMKSLDIVMLATELEITFNSSIKEDEIIKALTVEDVAKLVEREVQ